MILPRFELVEPNTVKDACAFLKNNDKARLIAGGTDLLVSMKQKTDSADLLVSLAKIQELKTISFSAKTGLSLGPMVSIAEIEASPAIKKNYPILSEAAGKIGSLQIRNRATVGGNICSARPAGDTIGPLIACGATLQITGVKGVRQEPIETIFKGPGETTIGNNEILTGISLKTPAAHTGSNYIKFTVRKAMEIAMVSVTCLVTIDKGICTSAKIILGAVGPTFIECPVAGQFLTGKKISDSSAEQAGKLASEACQARTSTRASAEYRISLVQTLVKRGLLEAALKIN